MELMRVFVAVSTDVIAWFVPSAKYMIRFTGSNEPRSKAPAAVVHPGIGIKPTVVRLALGVAVWAQNVEVQNTIHASDENSAHTMDFISSSSARHDTENVRIWIFERSVRSLH